MTARTATSDIVMPMHQDAVVVALLVILVSRDPGHARHLLATDPQAYRQATLSLIGRVTVQQAVAVVRTFDTVCFLPEMHNTAVVVTAMDELLEETKGATTAYHAACDAERRARRA